MKSIVRRNRILSMILGICLLCALTACASAGDMPSPDELPGMEPLSAAPDPTAQSARLPRPLAIGAKTFWQEKDLNAVPYVLDAEDGRTGGETVLLPLQPLAEAMGWRYQRSEADGQEAVLLTKAGKDDIALSYAFPSVGEDLASGVAALRGTQEIPIDVTLPYLDGTLYVPESFVSQALEAVLVTIEGGTKVVVEPRG